MAEYSITYEEIQDFVDDCISRAENPDFLKKYRLEILSAITAQDYYLDNNCQAAIRNSMELWKNQIASPSRLLLGKRYITIKDTVINLIEGLIVSGFIDVLIQKINNEPVALTVSGIGTIVFALIRVFESAKELEEFDFCIYMQAMTHFKEHEEFTIDDLKQWLPHDKRVRCNMHDSRWDCSHRQKDDSCGILDGTHLDDALKSLIQKNILDIKYKEKHAYIFKV